ELTATMAEIKLQRSLIRDEIDSGAMYGDERRAEHERSKPAHPLGDDIDEGESDALFDKEQEAATPAEDKPEPEAPKAEERTEDEKVQAFLNGGGGAAKAETAGFRDVLGGLTLF